MQNEVNVKDYDFYYKNQKYIITPLGMLQNAEGEIVAQLNVSKLAPLVEEPKFAPPTFGGILSGIFKDFFSSGNIAAGVFSGIFLPFTLAYAGIKYGIEKSKFNQEAPIISQKFEAENKHIMQENGEKLIVSATTLLAKQEEEMAKLEMAKLEMAKLEAAKLEAAKLEANKTDGKVADGKAVDGKASKLSANKHKATQTQENGKSFGKKLKKPEHFDFAKTEIISAFRQMIAKVNDLHTKYDAMIAKQERNAAYTKKAETIFSSLWGGEGANANVNANAHAHASSVAGLGFANFAERTSKLTSKPVKNTYRVSHADDQKLGPTPVRGTLEVAGNKIYKGPVNVVRRRSFEI